MNTGYFDRVHFYMTFQKDEAEILYHGLSKSALLSFEIDLMLPKDVEDLYHDGMVLFLGLAPKVRMLSI